MRNTDTIDNDPDYPMSKVKYKTAFGQQQGIPIVRDAIIAKQKLQTYKPYYDEHVKPYVNYGLKMLSKAASLYYGELGVEDLEEHEEL